ncbi:uncharacterized protein LOC110027609 isoform X2 [Phalaenopsis equestris]|uniref:uncharacterized protein LOC110027609 isoform X2 n=1 Tax=Phalaenopsis equestris TaxID=78828 RepID=UPI0009E4B834|nr:uncharacterized protein LOC110027609 isoform X2 [Phalaenopsis equestris]
MILVTGASGYLGGNICRALIADGHTVRAFVRRSSDLSCLGIGGDGDGREGMDSSLELAYGDITDLPSLLEACAGCDVIFHTAALVEPWLPDPSRLISVHQGKLFCTEYEKSKVIADKIALDAATNGAPIVLLYPGVIYGSGRLTTGNILAHILIERFNGRLPGYIGHGNDVLSFVHVKDLVSAHIAAMHKGQVGERYLLTGENASLAHVFDIAAAITKTSKPRIHIPLWLIELYGWITVFFARMTGRLPLISYPTVRVLKHQWAYSCQRARDQLGYCPRSLNEGMAEVLPWLRGLGLIKY